MHRIYWGAPLVQEARFWCTKWNKRCVGTGKALLVYQQGQDISFGPVEGNCGRTVGVIPDSHPSTLGAALSFQIQTTIIPGEKMVVIHPGRHHWLESGAESHFFHPMHKPGIFRHTLSYMTTMEIRSFTYRFLRRTINGAQLFKYQRYKRNVGQLLYGFLKFLKFYGLFWKSATFLHICQDYIDSYAKRRKARKDCCSFGT